MSKINFILPNKVKNKITTALRKYGPNEIGGILIGSKKEENHFEIVDISISNEESSPSFWGFIRETKKSEKLLKKHFKKSTGYYLGEWHSHPKFRLTPSTKDISTMIGILGDENYGVTFVILLVTHLVNDNLKYKGYFLHKNLDEIITLF